LAICSTLIEPNAIIGRFLELSILRWIGRLSYSLYIWQQLFLGFGVIYRPFGFLSSPRLATISAVLVACLSYYLLELPLMRLGHRITGKGTREKRAFAVASGATMNEQAGLVGPIAEGD
jgi:peptidoglycan/LPS O-acetylase OafA/YrhL